MKKKGENKGRNSGVKKGKEKRKWRRKGKGKREKDQELTGNCEKERGLREERKMKEDWENNRETRWEKEIRGLRGEGRIVWKTQSPYPHSLS